MQSKGSSGIAMNVNSGGKERGNGEMMMIFAVALGTGYFLGSSKSLSLGSIWEIILVLEGWVRDVVVPVYTLSALSYLLIDNYYDSKPSPSSEKKSSLRCSLCSFQIPPVLRKLSSLTLCSKDEDTDSLIPATPEEEEEEDEGEKPIDMNGVFKVVENDNFDKFLEAQGVPWFLCNAASKARPTHHFTHASFKKLTIKIQGIIESQTSYQINGPYTETSIRGRLFQDSLSYLYDENGDDDKTCVGVQTRKVAMGQGYVVEVQRRIIRAKSVWAPTPEENPDGHCTYDLGIPCDFDRLIMTNKVVYDEDKEPVIASQLFHRQDLMK